MADQGKSHDQFAAAQFRALLDSTSQGIIGVDSTGAIQLVNRKAEAQFGYALGELLGQNIEVLVPERARDIHAEERKQYSYAPWARPMGFGMELKGRRRDGSEFPIEISLNHVQAGNAAMTIGLVTDITARIEMEEHMRQAHKMEALGQLAGGLAHEFNNLLTVISGYSDMLLDGCRADAEDRRSLEHIAKAADRAAGLTRQLMTFSRRQVVQPKRFNLNQRISQMQSLLCGLVGEKIELKLTLGENFGEILGDPAQVDDVIVNLVQNARDAMPDGGRLLIETAAIEVGEAFDQWHMPLNPGQHVMLTVIDTGVGMTPDVQARIFEPFFTTKAVGQGTGLGLAAVYGIVKDSGGSIRASSEPNQGTTFRLIFPLIWKVRDGQWRAVTA
jgi:PAS domain S-box-containing protein